MNEEINFDELSYEDALHYVNEFREITEKQSDQIIAMTETYQELKKTHDEVMAHLDEIGKCDRCGTKHGHPHLLVADVACYLCNQCRTDFSAWMCKHEAFTKFRGHSIKHAAHIAAGREIAAFHEFEKTMDAQPALIDIITDWLDWTPD